MTATPHTKYVRHRLFPRMRHNRHGLAAFVAAQATRLAASATGATVSPVNATNDKASMLVTFAGQVANGDVITVGAQTYTFKTALTEVFANQTLTNDGTNVANGDTVTVAGKVYTFQTTLTNVDGNVHIGAANTNSMTNLFNAINGSGGVPGTDYAAATTANASVTATNPTGTTVKVTAKSSGVAGNSIAVSESSAHLSWGAPTLAGGVNAVANEVFIGALATDSRDNLVAAITAGAGGGTKYASNTVAHTQVTAAAASGNMTLTVLNSFIKGVQVKVSEVAANLSIPASGHLDGPSWTATGHPFVEGEGPVVITNSGGALPTGTPTGELWVHVLDANTVAFATSRSKLDKGDFIITTSAGSGTQTAKRSGSAQGIFDLLKQGNKPRTVAAAADIDTLK